MSFVKNGLLVKVFLGYAFLVVLLFSGMYFTRKQITSMSDLLQKTNVDNQKTVQLTKLVSIIYETDVLNKQYLNQLILDSVSYRLKIDSIHHKIDSFSRFFPEYKSDLDSLGTIISKNAGLIIQLQQIQQKSDASLPQNSFLEQLNAIIRNSGKLTVTDFIPNFNQLSKREKEAAKSYVDYLNENIPSEAKNVDLDYLDSLISVARFHVEFDKKQAVNQLKDLKNREIELLFTTLRTSFIITDMLHKLEKQIYDNISSYGNKEKELTNRLHNITHVLLFIAIWISVLFLVLLIWDVMRQQRFVKQLQFEKAEKSNLILAREQMTNALSHDVKTPIQAILTYAKMMKTAKSEVEIQQYSQYVISSSHYVLGLVQDVLEYSKIQTGKITFFPSFVHLNDVIAELVQIQSDYFKSKDIVVKRNTSATDPYEFWMDEIKIKQILNNLLSNAFKYTDQGQVTVVTHFQENVKNKKLLLQVSDTGIGIPDTFKPFIFDEFRQARATDVAKGTGLGLFITKQLVTSMGGEIDFVSSPKGTDFSVLIPISEFRQKSERVPFDWSEQHFLVIDDDEMQLELTCKSLRSTQANCTAIQDFTKHVHLLDSQIFTAIITDIQMPHMDGFEVLKYVRSSQKNSQTQVIALTGLEMDKVQDFDAVLPKRLSKMAFLEQICLLLQLPSPDFIGSKDVVSTSDEDFSLDVILSYANQDKKECKHLLDDFIQQNNDLWRHYEIALHEANFEEISFVAHKLSNFYALIQAEKVTHFLKNSEKQPQVANISDFLVMQAYIKHLHDRVLNRLNRLE